MNLNNKIIGGGIIFLSLCFLIILIIFKIQSNDLIGLQMQNTQGSCLNPEGECLHEKSEIPFYIGLILIILQFFFGFYVLIEKQGGNKKFSKKHYENEIKILSKDEKNVFEKIIESDGTIFQSELVEKTEFNKVKVTRILDMLEGKNLIERKRRGMTNVIILKH
jgi:hypothetical protein